MGKKKMNFYLICLLLAVCMNMYSQNGWPEKIEWFCNNCIYIDNVVYDDTCQLKEKSFMYPKSLESCYFKSINVRDKSFFFSFYPFGSGVPWWEIKVFKQENGKWKMVADGEVVMNAHFITAEFDSSKNIFVFYSLNAEWDQNGDISLTKEDEIGELSLDDL